MGIDKDKRPAPEAAELRRLSEERLRENTQRTLPEQWKNS